MTPKSLDPGVCAVAESNAIVVAKQAKSASNKDRIKNPNGLRKIQLRLALRVAADFR